MKIEPHKFISAVFLGLLFGLLNHHSDLKWNHLGRAAYMEFWGRHFDRFITIPHSLVVSILAAIVVLLLVIGAYELIAMGLSRILKTPTQGTQ
jgi:hypothetical protein